MDYLSFSLQESETKGTGLLEPPLATYEGEAYLYTSKMESDTPTFEHTGSRRSDSDVSDSGCNRGRLSSSGSITSSELIYPPPKSMIQSVQSKTFNKGHIHFVTPIEELTCDSTGGTYQCDAHDIAITIPEGAVDDDSPVHLEIGVALQGPFAFPNSTKPVSPIVWLSTDQEGTPFERSIEVTLPHCISYSEESPNGGILTFFMGEKKQGETFRFEKVRKSGSGIQADYGTIHTRLSKHPCFICIATTSKSNREVISRTNYCISKVVPKFPQKHYKVHFYVTYDLPSCIEVRLRNFQKKKLKDISPFSFDIDGKKECCESVW